MSSCNEFPRISKFRPHLLYKKFFPCEWISVSCLNSIDVSFFVDWNPPAWPNHLPFMPFFQNNPSRGHWGSCNFLFLFINTALLIKSCQSLIFSFYLDAFLGHVWKFHQLFLISTFSMINWDTLVQILSLNSNKKYGFQALHGVRFFLHTLLLDLKIMSSLLISAFEYYQ